MAESRLAVTLPGSAALCAILFATALATVWAVPARADEPQSLPEARIIVTGEGSVSAAPDYAQVRSGVTTRAKTVKEGVDANSKIMTAINTALLDAGIAAKDIQTARFSVQPVYAAPEPHGEPKLTGYSITHEVEVTVRQIAKIGEVLDRLVAAGAIDVGNIAFLISDPSKRLDQAREMAVADARRKAELYAHAFSVNLGRIAWITEVPAYAPPVAKGGMLSQAAAAPVPIATGEDTLQVRITVGFDLAR